MTAVERVRVDLTFRLDVRAALAHAKLSPAVAGHVVAPFALDHHRMATRALLAHLTRSNAVHVGVDCAKGVHHSVRAIRTANAFLLDMHKVSATVNTARVKLVTLQLNVFHECVLRKPACHAGKNRAAVDAGDRGQVQNMPLDRVRVVDLVLAREAHRRVANIARQCKRLEQRHHAEFVAAEALLKLDTLGLHEVDKALEVFGVPLTSGLKGCIVKTFKHTRQFRLLTLDNDLMTERTHLLGPHRVDNPRPLLESEARHRQLERLVQDLERLRGQELEAETKDLSNLLKRHLDPLGIQAPRLKGADESHNLRFGTLDDGDVGNELRCLPHGQAFRFAVQIHLVKRNKVPRQQFLEHFLDTLVEGNLGVQKFRKEHDDFFTRQPQANAAKHG